MDVFFYAEYETNEQATKNMNLCQKIVNLIYSLVEGLIFFDEIIPINKIEINSSKIKYIQTDAIYAQ